MSITTTTLADDNFKVIIKANGGSNEDKELLLDASKLNKATASPNVSIASVHHEILGTGKITLFFDAQTNEEIATTFSGRGNYGLKKDEPKIKQGDTGATLINPTGDILLSTDSNVSKYNILIEFRKEKGFTNG
tara:strand:- start:933 stop:1334 length:402 start_codon:yes stop_codon:yes gene_type:complete